ncbi:MULTISPECIES: hypothetical protein [Proteus]|uniref:hypothetical protein n=1 Tax=Proteus TaxID=583 RepID=UPI001929C260|nr:MULTISPECIES: hypothetical protein [Proteus]MCX2587076.1 hypothetical protein [Proteus penneri]NBL76992.1 hypothetical protein [Proteus sp. G2672]NBL89007.1 hypothetical protein [Proteus sp. G2673]NBM02279.1 hypothetical protein [Proteus sp. G2671]NBM50869.1 hypothetical protein [Proteus sp. G2666]
MSIIKLSFTLSFLFFTSLTSTFAEHCPPTKPDCDVTHDPLARQSEKQTVFDLKTIK